MHRKLIIDEEKINKIKQKGYLSVEEDICFNNIPEILRFIRINNGQFPKVTLFR